MADTLQVVVRTLHILFGIFWVGGLLVQHVVGASLRRLPPHQGGPSALAIGKRLLPAGLVAAALTIVFGIWNQYLIYGKLQYQGGTAQLSLGVALIASLAMLGMMGFVSLPTMRKMEAMAPKGPPAAPAAAPVGPPPALIALQKRMIMVLMVNTVLALTVVVAMVVATLARTG